MQKQKTYFNWSAGKDSALALHYLLQSEDYQVERLLTSMNAHFNRVSMHGIRRILVEQQARSIGLPLSTIELPEEPDMETYEKRMRAAIDPLRAEGFTTAAFGDIYLEDLRAYREEQLISLKMSACFPLWKRDTRDLLSEFLKLGFKTVVVSVKSELLDESFVGRVLDQDFLADLPANVDPCGENGEFHTFCFDGPIFSQAVEFTVGEKIYKEYKAARQDNDSAEEKPAGFWYCDLLPVK